MFTMKNPFRKTGKRDLGLPKNLSKAQEKEILRIIRKARRDDGIPRSAQDSIPFQRMFPDGICRVTDQYSHILDDDRQQNAKLFEKAFYRKDIVREDTGEHLPAVETKTGAALTSGDRQLLEKLMSDESTATLLMNLLKKLS